MDVLDLFFFGVLVGSLPSFGFSSRVAFHRCALDPLNLYNPFQRFIIKNLPIKKKKEELTLTWKSFEKIQTIHCSKLTIHT